MHEFINHPAVQAGLAPFLIGLITAELFQRIRLSGLAIIAGFAITIYLTSSFSFDPLTSTRKIVLLGLISAAAGLLFTLLRLSLLASLLPFLGGAAAVWVALRILQHQSPQTALLWGAGCATYVAALVWGMDSLENDPLRATSAAAALGIGTGASALIGASALLGQFGLAIGSAAAALVLIQFITNHTFSTGRVFTLPFAVIAGTTGCIAVLSARLPWYALPLLVIIPHITRLVTLPGGSLRIQSMVLGLLTFSLAGGAIFLTWRTVGDIPF